MKFDPYEVTFGDTISAGPYHVQTWNPRKEEFSFCIVNDIQEKADRLDSLLNQVPLNTLDMVVQVDVSRDQLNVTVRKIDGQTVEAFFVKSRSTE
ncbi:MAG TPA: hypothetical protein PK373_11185 [Sedimentisphaerales bacterium]|nr:hypothetical protein [Sedimentisphaerales bacterium]HQG49643.1 hypothetical protein [Sedimentisphaerales bacterium]